MSAIFFAPIYTHYNLLSSAITKQKAKHFKPPACSFDLKTNLMAFLKFLLLFSVLLLSSTYCSAQLTNLTIDLTPSGEFCNVEINNATQVSVNIDIILTKLVLTTPFKGYSIASSGFSDKVYGLAQCRGDTNSTDCFLCIQDAAKQIKQRCPNTADSRIWYDSCFLRYDTNNFYGQIDTANGIFIFNVNNVTEQAVVFERTLGALMNTVVSEAVVPSNKGFGRAKAQLSASDTIYALAQCNGDLSKKSCTQCLAAAVNSFNTVCSNKQGCRVLYTGCYARYELFPFS